MLLLEAPRQIEVKPFRLKLALDRQLAGPHVPAPLQLQLLACKPAGAATGELILQGLDSLATNKQ